MIGTRHSIQADVRNVYTVFYTQVDKLDRKNQGNETKGLINGQNLRKS